MTLPAATLALLGVTIIQTSPGVYSYQFTGQLIATSFAITPATGSIDSSPTSANKLSWVTSGGTEYARIWTGTARITPPLWNVPPTGKTRSVLVVDVFQIGTNPSIGSELVVRCADSTGAFNTAIVWTSGGASTFVIDPRSNDGSLLISSAAGGASATLPPGAAGQVLVSNGPGADPSWGTGLPPGIVLPTIGATADSGFLLCDGSAVSRATYSALLARTPQVQKSSPAGTTLNGAINAGQTSIVVNSAAGWPGSSYGQFEIQVENEIMLVTAGFGTTTWTVVRGVEGTTAASHATGKSVSRPVEYAFGVGDGSTTFNLPDLRGRSVRGADASVTTLAVLGYNEGEQLGTTSAPTPHAVGSRQGGIHTHPMTQTGAFGAGANNANNVAATGKGGGDELILNHQVKT